MSRSRAHPEQETDKEKYFREIYSLCDSSGEEEELSDARQVLSNSKPSRAPSSSFSVASQEPARRLGQQAVIPKTIPTVKRTTSDQAPGVKNMVSSASRRTTSGSHEVPSKSRGPGAAQIQAQPKPLSVNDKPTPLNERSTIETSVSTPNIGSVVLTNSTGITSMLQKKRKRKDSSVVLVPEKQRILAGKTFFYIPPDDVTLMRKKRIGIARSYGAVWTKEWSDDITHVIVDTTKQLKYEDVITFLRPLMKSDSLSDDITLVNDDYFNDCTQFHSILDPHQKRYAVERAENNVVEKPPSTTEHAESEKSLELKKSKSTKRDDPPAKVTPDISQRSAPNTEDQNTTEPSPGIWLPGKPSKVEAVVDSPRDTPSLSQDPFRPHDELDDMIDVARQTAHLPIDDEEDEKERPSSSEGIGDVGSDEEVDRVAKRKTRRKITGKQNNFVCMRSGTGVISDTNPNAETITILQEMATYYERMRDQWRSRAYNLAIGSLKQRDTKISTYDDAFNLPSIGHRIALKIEEIVLTHRLRRLDSTKIEPQDQTLQLFLKIYGVGLTQASKWINMGYRTLDDLQSKAHLTPNQRLGIEHFDDFNTRIPRAEVASLGEIVKKACVEIDPEVEAIIGGSYRRGASSSGDIDFILTKPGTSSEAELMPLLTTLVERLTSSGFLVAALAVPRHENLGGSKWHGACVLPPSASNSSSSFANSSSSYFPSTSSPAAVPSPTSPHPQHPTSQIAPPWRRIDLLLVPDTQLGAALIYFTGDDFFNRSMRLLASKKGMRLNQRGLYWDSDVLQRGQGRGRGRGGDMQGKGKGRELEKGELIEGRDERKIFEILGVPWRRPGGRICR